MPDDRVAEVPKSTDLTLDNGEGAADGSLASRFVEGLAACGIAKPADVAVSGLAVGVSGGPDSMALAALAQRWCAEHGLALRCFIVDHNLRQEAAEEAARVQSWLTERGVSAEVLTSTDPIPRSDIQNEARKRRYTLMLDRCRELGVGHLLVAHHLDDQAETFLLRLARGSGVQGLSAMAPSVRLGDVRLLRPLLGVRRAELHRILEALDWPYVRDPSNENREFARVRMRKLMPRLAEEGLDAQRLAQTAHAMARASRSIGHYVRLFLAESVRMMEPGYAHLHRDRLADVPEEVGLRALSYLVQRIGGRFYPPRLETVEAAYQALRMEGSFKGRTVAGCQLVPDRQDDDIVFVCREEAGAASSSVALRTQVHWDGRFALAFDRETLDFPRLEKAGYRIGALTRAGREWLVADLRNSGDKNAADRLKHPTPAVWEAAPAVWRNDSLVAVPHIGWIRAGEVDAPIPDRFAFVGPVREDFG